MLFAAILAPAPAPTLDRPFTLVYRATFRDVRPKTTKDAALEAVRKDLAARVSDDALSADAAALALDAYRKTLDAPPMVETLTLSFDGHALLIDEDAAATLVSADGTLHFAKGKTDGVRGVWSAVALPEWTSVVPLLGPALPLLPTMKGKTTNDARGAVVKVVAMETMTTLSAHVPLNGALVARWIVRARTLDGVPLERAEYSLVTQIAAPLPADRFKPERYVADGDEVAVLGKGNLIFDPKKGSLALQIAALQRP